jgi:hypothetical protein
VYLEEYDYYKFTVDKTQIVQILFSHKKLINAGFVVIQGKGKNLGVNLGSISKAYTIKKYV